MGDNQIGLDRAYTTQLGNEQKSHNSKIWAQGLPRGETSGRIGDTGGNET